MRIFERGCGSIMSCPERESASMHIVLIQHVSSPEDQARWPRLRESCLRDVHAPEQSRQAKQERWRLARSCLALATTAASKGPSCRVITVLISSSPDLEVRFCASPLSYETGTQNSHLDRSGHLLTARVPPSRPIPYLNSSMFFYRLLLFFQRFVYIRLHNETIESSSQDEKSSVSTYCVHMFVLSIQKVFGKARSILISPYVRSEYESDHALSLLPSRDTMSFLHVELS
jgi:hypothetical protein